MAQVNLRYPGWGMRGSSTLPLSIPGLIPSASISLPSVRHRAGRLSLVGADVTLRSVTSDNQKLFGHHRGLEHLGLNRSAHAHVSAGCL